MRKVFCLFAAILAIVLGHVSLGTAANDLPPSNATPADGTLLLTLDQAIELALGGNRSVLASQYNLDSRHFTLDSAASEFELKIAPSTGVGILNGDSLVNAQLGLGKKFENGIFAGLSPGIGKTKSQYASTVGLELAIPLLKGFGKETNLSSVNNSLFGIAAAKNSLVLQKVNTVLDTVRAVYDIINQNELVALFQSNVQRLNQYVVSARIKESVGLATAMDTYRATIRLKDVEDSLARAQEAYENAQDTLKLILSIPQERSIRVDAPLNIDLVDIDLNTAIDTAFENRVELSISRTNVNEAERQARVSKKNTQPELNLVVNYQALGKTAALSDTLTFNDHIWSVNLESNTDWFRRSAKADYRKSLVAVKIANLGAANRRDEIKREVRMRLAEMKKLDARMRIFQEQIHQAQGKLALAKVKFNHGMADNFDVIEAETQLQQAHANLLAVKSSYIIGTYRLRSAMGTLL